MTATGKATRYPRSFGLAWQDGLPGLPVVVGLTGELGELVRLPGEAVPASFIVARTGATGPTCSVDWRVEGTGSSPVTADYFAGGVLPEGIATFAPTATEFPVTIILSAGTPPPSPLTGRVMLFDPAGCRLAEGHAELAFSIAAGVIEDEAVVSLELPDGSLAPDPAGPVVVPFTVNRSGDTAVVCSVGWRVEGTGDNPVVLADFVGGVLPTGTENFAAEELVEHTSFSLAAAAPPATARTGRIVLAGPVDCSINPSGEFRPFSLEAGTISQEPWRFLPENIAVQPAPGQAARVVFSEPGGVPQVAIAGAANADDLNVAIWFEGLPPQNYELVWEYEKNEDTPAADAGGRFVQVWGALLGTTKPADVTTWTSAQWGNADDADYGDHSQSWRISHDTESTNPDNANEARLVVFDSGESDRPVGTPGPNFWMEGASQKYRMVLRRDGEHVTLSKTPGGEAIQWTGPDLTRQGRIGWRFARGRGGILRHHPDGSPFIRDLGGGGGPVTPTGDFPYGPWRVWQRATGTGPGIYRVDNAADLRTRIANAQSGDQILLPAGGSISLGGDLQIDRRVSGEDAFYIATDTDSDDEASFCRLTGGAIIIDGARKLVMNGIRQAGQRLLLQVAELCQFERFHVTNMVNPLTCSDPSGEGRSYRYPSWLEVQDRVVQNCMLGFVHYDRCSAAFFDQKDDNWPYRLLITHPFLDSCTGVGKILQPGRNPYMGMHDGQCILQYMLDTSNRLSCTDQYEFKTNGWIIQHNTSYDTRQVKIRHGRIAARPGVAGPAKGNLFLGNLWICGGIDLTARGAYHEFRNNWCIKSGSPSLDSPLGSGEILAQTGHSDGETFPETENEESGNNRLMSAYAMRAGGNRGFSVRPNGDDPEKPKDCIATKAGQGRNSSVASGGWGSGLDTTTRLPDADIDRIPVMMTPAKVGPRGWRSQFAQVYRP
jgi:hypothetical protein